MINGVINIYKEAGFTSHDVVAKLRGLVKQKKIGHTGTLDPAAEGVLPVCLGNATKLCDLITDWDKTYEAVLLLGRSTDTQDTTGETLLERPVEADEETVRTVIASFEGDYDQVPPMYSALKVDGKKLYELARAGKEVERKARPVYISKLEILSVDLPRVRMRVTCSKGTYIRTLCHDIGEKLGCGGCMEHLLRARVGHFPVEVALRLSEIQELADTVIRELHLTAEELGADERGRVRLTPAQMESYQETMKARLGETLVAVEDIFPRYEKIATTTEGDKLLYNGNPLYKDQVEWPEEKSNPKDGDAFRVYDSGKQFLGVYGYVAKERRLRPIKMFLEKES